VRPLDRLSSIKLKLGVLIVAAVAAGVCAFDLAENRGIGQWLAFVIAIAVGLAAVQVLSRGMTSPLREMADAAEAMAGGDYSRRITATSRDEVGQLAASFNAMAIELQETDQVRRDLVANVSHELRTPLAALQAGLENIIDGIEPADRETLALMLAQVERLSRLVRQLLDLSRLESGITPLTRRPFPAADVLDRVIAEARLLRGDANVHVEVRPSFPGPIIDGDPERVHQLVSNLVANAVRHSPPGGRVAVRAEQQERGGIVVLEVADDGPGIPPGEAQRVFERFHRLDQARAADDGGSGLGLAIARWIVDLHGGTIRVANGDEPSGCRMVVTLPGGAA
jgi:signal transduction histidine kinase